MVLPMETIARGADPTCETCGETPPLRVCSSMAGYYVGTYCDCGPYSRESDYYKTRELAEAALAATLVRLVSRIRRTLWPLLNPDEAWTLSTLAIIAGILEDHAIGKISFEVLEKYMSKTKKKKKCRLAKGADGVERSWTPFELFALYLRGWKDGAMLTAMRQDRNDVPEYDTGYADGCRARHAAYSKAAKRLKCKLSVLRLAKGEG